MDLVSVINGAFWPLVCHWLGRKLTSYQKPELKADGSLAMRMGWPYRWGAIAVPLIGVVGLPLLVVFAQPSTRNPLDPLFIGLVFFFIVGLGGVAAYQINKMAITVKKDGLRGANISGKQLFLHWGDITAVGYSPGVGLRLSTTSGEEICVSEMYVGFPMIVDRLKHEVSYACFDRKSRKFIVKLFRRRPLVNQVNMKI